MSKSIRKSGIGLMISGVSSWIIAGIFALIIENYFKNGPSVSSFEDLERSVEMIRVIDKIRDVLLIIAPIEFVIGAIFLIIGFATMGLDSNKNNTASNNRVNTNYSNSNYGYNNYNKGNYANSNYNNYSNNYNNNYNNPVRNQTYKTQAAPGFWICPKCNRENADYVGHCGCGEGKPSDNPVNNSSAGASVSSVSTAESTADHNAGYVLQFCPACGQRIGTEGQVYCAGCGYKLK